MTEAAKRFDENPILQPSDCKPSRTDLVVECLLNPGVFRYKGKIGLLLRVSERPRQEKRWISTPILDSSAEGGIKILRFRRDDPDLRTDDPRVFTYRGTAYLTTLSHLRLAWSEDGRKFLVDETPTLVGAGPLEAFGIEDCRVTELEGASFFTHPPFSFLA